MVIDGNTLHYEIYCGDGQHIYIYVYRSTVSPAYSRLQHFKSIMNGYQISINSLHNLFVLGVADRQSIDRYLAQFNLFWPAMNGHRWIRFIILCGGQHLSIDRTTSLLSPTVSIDRHHLPRSTSADNMYQYPSHSIYCRGQYPSIGTSHRL